MYRASLLRKILAVFRKQLDTNISHFFQKEWYVPTLHVYAPDLLLSNLYSLLANLTKFQNSSTTTEMDYILPLE